MKDSLLKIGMTHRPSSFGMMEILRIAQIGNGSNQSKHDLQ